MIGSDKLIGLEPYKIVTPVVWSLQLFCGPGPNRHYLVGSELTLQVYSMQDNFWAQHLALLKSLILQPAGGSGI